MSKFEEREKTFEKKFANDQELKFKVESRRNKYIGQWASTKLGKNENDTLKYIEEVIKADFEKPGDEDVFVKIKNDFKNHNIYIEDSEIRNQINTAFERAKKDFI